MNIKGMIFDLDGTLLDSAWVWGNVDKEFLGKRGIEVPKDYAKTIAPMGFAECARYTIKRFGLNQTVEEVMEEWFKMAKYKYDNEVCLVKGAGEYLKHAYEQGIKLGVATASDKRLFTKCLKRNNIDSLFHSITTISEVEAGKDSPDIYIREMEKLGLDIKDCIVYEDLPVGIKAAKQAGFRTVGVRSHLMEKDIDTMKTYADYIIDDFISCANVIVMI